MSSLAIQAFNLTLQARADRLAQLEPEALRVQAVTAARDMDEAGLWAVLEAFLVLRSSRGARVSVRTLEAYQAGLKALLEWAGPAGMSLLRPRGNDGFRYVRHLEALGLAPASVRVRLAAARMLYAALRWAGATDAAPFTDVKAAHDPVPAWEKRKPYADSEVRALLAAAEVEDRVIILLGSDCGLRVTEMSRMLRGDVHLGGERPYLVVTGKREKRQRVPLSRRTEAALGAWLSLTPGYGPHLLTIRTRRAIEDRLKRLCERADIPYQGVHSLRHRAGTKAYKQTRDILVVRDLLRHANTQVTERYVHHAREGEVAVNRDWE